MLRGALTLAGIIALAAVLVSSGPSPAHAGTGNQEAEDIVTAFLDAVADGDSDTISALTADDFLLTEASELSGSFAIYGKPALVAIIDEFGSTNVEITVRSIDSEGQRVTGVYEWSDDDTAAAGVPRYVESFIVDLTSDDLVTRIQLAFDETDADTQQYLAFLDAQEEEDDGEFEGDFIEVSLAAPPTEDELEAGEEAVSGSAFIFGFGVPGVSGAGVDIAPFPAGGLQPASIRSGTCETPGAIVQPLAATLNGQSFTAFSRDIADITGELILVVQDSESNTDIVACGAILGAVAAPLPAPTTPAPPPAPAPTTPAGTITSPDTGSGPGATAVPGWLYALALAGVSFAAIGATLRAGGR